MLIFILKILSFITATSPFSHPGTNVTTDRFLEYRFPWKCVWKVASTKKEVIPFSRCMCCPENVCRKRNYKKPIFILFHCLSWCLQWQLACKDSFSIHLCNVSGKVYFQYEIWRKKCCTFMILKYIPFPRSHHFAKYVVWRKSTENFSHKNFYEC